MKKRLLSAALALAMVLTMLPLSVMPAAAATEQPAANTGVAQINWTAPSASMNLTYYNTGAQLQGHTIKSPGWYAVVATSNGGTTTYNGYVIYKENGTGVITGINGGTWYQTLDQAITAKAGNLVLLGAATADSSTSLTPNNVSSLTIDLNGQTLGGTITIPATYTPAGGTAQPNSFSQLTIKDSTKSGSSYNASSSVGITVGNGAPKATATTINLNNVKVGAITANYTTACTVNVYGSETGNISLTGVSGGTVNVGNGNTTGKTGTLSLVTTGTAQGGTITATDAATGAITLSGVGARLTGTNLKASGAITLLGLADSTLTDAQKSTLATPTVTLNGGSVASIGQGNNEALSRPYSVTLNTNAKVNGINLNNANVTVNNSAAGAITVKNGDVKLNGSAAGPASAGAVTLGAANSEASLTVTGTNVTTGNITASNGTVKVTVPESETNVFGQLISTVDVANRGISGGKWSTAVPEANLNTNLRYQLSKGGKIWYYSDAQFQNVLNAYQIAHDTQIHLVKDNATAKNSTITFMDGTDKLAVLTYGTVNLPLVLPTSVNGRAVLKWTESKDGTSSTILSEPTPGSTYSTPTSLENRVLNAQVTDTTITKLMNVMTNENGITARLVGNVITLSGAVPPGTTAITVTVTTDGKPSQTANIVVLYDNGSVIFGNHATGLLPGAMSISNDRSTLIIGNGSASYTLNGSGLRGQADGLTGKIHGYTETALPVIVTVNCSGTGWTNVRKAELAAEMSNDVANFGTWALTKNNGSQVSFVNSPAVKEALNAAVAGITQSQIDSWILNAQNTAWRKNHNTNPTALERASTGYQEVHLVAYMAVNVTNYNTANTPGTLTMTLTPSYYVEVTGKDGKIVTDATNLGFALDPTKPNELNALRPVNNRSLGSLTGVVGTAEATNGIKGIELTLTAGTGFTHANTYAHQGGTYGYKNSDATALKFAITHAVNGALGQFIVDGQAPMVSLWKNKPTGTSPNASDLLGYYETLQAAVDDAEEGQYIDVDANYKGSCNINVTGMARKFLINTNGANKVTSNVSGVVTEMASGSEYQVQLAANTVAPNGDVSISVVSVANGYAQVSATRAKPGAVVTITAVPSAGYRAAVPTVRYSTKTNSSNVLNVTATGANTWTFTVPADATGVTVTPSFVLQNNALPFTDVAASAWYYDGVKYCYETTHGNVRLMEGRSDTIFDPNGYFERAMVVQILWNMKGRPEPKLTRSPFYDVSATTGTHKWAYKAILWAYENGYAKGYPDGSFKPGQYVTRQEMAQFLYQAAGSPRTYNSVNLGYYSDGWNVNGWAQNAMRWATARGILSGRDSVGLGNTLAPRMIAKRSEVAVTVMNFDKVNVF